MDLVPLNECLFEKLPDEILLKIFSFLRYKVIQRCSSVCRRWNAVSKDRRLKKRINLCHFNLSVEQLDNFAEFHCSSFTIDLRFNYLTPLHCDSLIHLLEKVQNLRRLDLLNCFQPVIGPRNLSSPCLHVNFLPSQLVHLSLRGSYYNGEPFLTEDAKKNLPNLRCLDLGESNKTWYYHFLGCSEIRSLRTLYLDNSFFVSSDVSYTSIPAIIEGFSSQFSNFTQLKVLDLEGVAPNFDVFVKIINEFIYLEKLFVGHNMITDRSFSKVNRTGLALRELCIRDTRVTVNGIYNFLSNISPDNEFTLSCAWRGQCTAILDSNPNWTIKNSPLREEMRCYHYYNHECL